MKKIAFILFVLSITLVNCTSDSSTEPILEKSGQISLHFDKANTPEGVVEVIAFLSRDGYDTLSSALNIISSNSAEILFNEVDAGLWHLRVNALDSNNAELYSGETDINVLPNQVVPVSLILVPNSSGFGSIYILANWSENNNFWFDFPLNPVIPNNNFFYAPNGFAHTFVMNDEGVYKMWYSGIANDGMSYVFYATSSNGLVWTPYSNFPVIVPSDTSNWDSGRISAGPVIKINNTYRMYFHTFQNQYDTWYIGVAFSNDGVVWEKYPDPILSGGFWDQRIAATDIKLVDSTYYLYYSGWNQPYYYAIGLATSNDGIHFAKYSGNPILTKSVLWEGDGVASASIIYEDGIYKMVYVGTKSSDTGFGFAYSSDGISWVKDLSNPFFKTENTVTNALKIAFPNLLKTENEYRVYYNGFSYSNGNYISVAREFIP